MQIMRSALIESATKQTGHQEKKSPNVYVQFLFSNTIRKIQIDE